MSKSSYISLLNKNHLFDLFHIAQDNVILLIESWFEGSKEFNHKRSIMTICPLINLLLDLHPLNQWLLSIFKNLEVAFEFIEKIVKEKVFVNLYIIK